MLKQIPCVFFDGPVGRLETVIFSVENPNGIAVVLHPNPTQGGSNQNKVVHTIAKALNKRGIIAYCPNLRGVGQSEGTHDYGIGETEDTLAMIHAVQKLHPNLPLILAGFSFGAFVQTLVQARLNTTHPTQLLLVGLAAGKYTTPLPAVPAHSIIIHGEADEVIPLQAVLDWARPQKLPVTVIPAVGHFFHGHLPLLAGLITRLIQAS